MLPATLLAISILFASSSSGNIHAIAPIFAIFYSHETLQRMALATAQTLSRRFSTSFPISYLKMKLTSPNMRHMLFHSYLTFCTALSCGGR